MSGSGRIPLWIVATVAGLGAITILGTFFMVPIPIWVPLCKPTITEASK